LNSSKYHKQRNQDEARFRPRDPEEIKDWTSIGVSRSKAIEYAIQCDEDELEFLSPTIAEMKMAARALGAISREMPMETFNERVVRNNERTEKQAVCVKCGKWTDRQSGQTENELFYCGYCHAVCFGQKNTRWIPGKKE
jgi:hypothetical protein